MSVEVLVKSEKVIEACFQKVRRIKEERLCGREAFVLTKTVGEPFWLCRLFGARSMTSEEANTLADELESRGRAGWLRYATVQEERCIVLAKMAGHASHLTLTYDEFVAAGLHNVKE